MLNAGRVLSAGLVALVAIGLPSAPRAQTPASPPPARDCSAPEHRQFDFWIGTWNVTSQGKPAGTNRIEADLKGCALVEHWQSASGSRGTSLNFYDRTSRSWHQAWMDEQGNALRLEGGLRDGRMVMHSTPVSGTSSTKTIHRLTWSPEPDGSVRQLWESTTDGKTWSVVFDGRYVKR